MIGDPLKSIDGAIKPEKLHDSISEKLIVSLKQQTEYPKFAT